MVKYAAVPELVAAFMEASEKTECWVTVRDLREHFSLSRYQAGTFAGFLHRLEFSTYREFPYIVKKVEMLERDTPSSPLRYRYLLARRTGRPVRTVTEQEPDKNAGCIPVGTMTGQ